MFSRPDSGVQMDPDIADPYPRLGSGKSANWVDGRLAPISPDRPESVGRSTSSNGVNLPGRNIGKRCLNFGTFLAAPAAIWKCIIKLANH